MKSVHTVETWEGKEQYPEDLPREWQRTSWFAFLIRCANEKKLAQILENAFRRLESESEA